MRDINVMKFMDAVDETHTMKLTGRITQVIGLVIESAGPNISMRDL